VTVKVPWIWSPDAEPPDPTDILPPLETVAALSVPPLLTTSVPPLSTVVETTMPLDMTVSVTPALTVSPEVVPLEIVDMLFSPQRLQKTYAAVDRLLMSS
jgi:hypothetical protein